MMRTNRPPLALVRRISTVIALLALGAGTAAAQGTHTVRLIAAPFTKTVTLPNQSTVAVPMWGFALDANGNGVLDAGEAPTVPGPRITVPVGAATLEVLLTNRLSGPGAEPVSLVVLGLDLPPGGPTRNADGRIVAMTAETALNATQTYTFNGLRPGTFLYQSGSHQAVQVQMGLYGAVTQDVAAAAPGTPAQAYAGVPYDNEALVLYSEIDVELHAAVNAGTYGDAAAGGPTSTLDYAPSLFLVNGESYANELTAALAGGAAGQRTIVRLLNSGLRTHAPVLENGAFTFVAEDGNAYPFPRNQATVLLAAGKTQDAIWTPASSRVYSLYDRALSLSAAGQGPAGMLVALSVSEAPPPPGAPVPPVAQNDGFGTAEDTPVAAPVLANDTAGAAAELLTVPHSGTATPAAGGFTYTPAADFFGVDSFTYRAVVGSDASAPATVTIEVSPVPDPPTALVQAVGVQSPDEIPITLNGYDPDGDPLTFFVTSLPDGGTLSIVDPATHEAHLLAATDLRTGPGTGTAIPSALLVYAPSTAPTAFTGRDELGFLAADAASDSLPAIVAVTVHPAEAAEAPTGSSLALSVVGSDGAAVAAYRWTLEEDNTFDVQPGVVDPNTLSVSFHRSYMPVVQAGDESAPPVVDPAKRYFVSVLPKTSGYTNGGAAIARGQTAVTVTVNATPIPTAQVRVRVFNDNSPTDGVWSVDEAGLAGFEVTLEDAGGRYGMSAAHQLMDTFGNQIGTIYAPCSAGPPDSCTSYEVVVYGKGYVVTDADGYALIQNLAPGKYGVKVRPPGGTSWVQTSTIEGTRTIDAWVKANEPPFFMEFGPPGPHAEIGMVQPTRDATVLGAGAGPFSTISGDVTNLRMSRPPDPSLYSGGPFDFTRPWVALNAGAVDGNLVFAGATDESGHFEIQGVPSGSYQLVIFDSALDVIIGSKVINVTGGTNVALGAQPVFSWYHRMYSFVFDDLDEDGFRDAGESGIPEQAVNIRWRDGSMYQSAPTDGSGFVPFEEVFPFFNWQVAEVDYTRFKATGVTVVVDGGGDPSTAANGTWPAAVGAPDVDPTVLVPQPQAENGGAPFRTETGPVLLEAFQGFIGQTNVLMWGKAPYAEPGSVTTDVNVFPFDDFPGPGDTDANENGSFDVDQYHGGITGIVHYSVTRAENDPRWGGAEVWEPGIPAVRVQLWDAKRATLLNEVTTDSWDLSLPEGCQGAVFAYLGQPKDCFDGLRNFNQVRPGVFDGGYAFYTVLEPLTDAQGAVVPIESRTTQKPLPAGEYVVKVIVPKGYSIVKEEDKNVDFGEDYIPAEFYLTGYALGDPGPPDPAGDPLRADYAPLWAPFCVGTVHDVPAELALFPGVPGVYGGERRPLCDAKLVRVRNGQNAAANFFLFTEAPIAAHIAGFVLDDTQNEFDPNSPQFGEKFAPPFLPVAIRDWTGREITRTYTDRFGVYNALVPSTFTANAPIPSGMSPAMLTACINAPTMPGPAGAPVPDPHFNKSYSHFCYTFQYMPGTTTYLDTPVVPTAAYTGADQFPVDAELPNRTPVIKQARGTALNLGPYVVDPGGNSPSAQAARTIVVESVGSVEVPNPAYAGVEGTAPKLITRDYGFGPSSLNGVLRLGGQAITVPAANWTNTQITAVVPTGLTFRTGQLTVERCLARATNGSCTDSRSSILGITLTVATNAMHNARPPRTVSPGQSIQSAIDAAGPGDLVLVNPGVYEEMVIMSKPVRLQGWGAPVTTINTVAAPSEKFQSWRDSLNVLLGANPAFLLDGQTDILGAPPFDAAELAAALGGEGAGVTVFARNGATLPDQGLWLLNICSQLSTSPYTLNNDLYCRQNENPGSILPVLRANARIDGFTITGTSQAPGVMVNAYARTLEIANNNIHNNTGNYAGGISVGHPGAVLPLADEDAVNYSVRIHNNLITQNAGLTPEGGGGVVLGTGAVDYSVSNNFVAANFTAGQGAGIAHIGRSQLGVIDRNAVVFNESFNQGITRSGGGIFVGGRPPAAGGLTPGTGNVRVSNNLIQGNQAAAGDGGGIALAYVNGQDVVDFPDPLGSLLRHSVDLFNNVITNNEAALAGGGIAMQDAAYVRLVHDTIVHNDSLATAGAAFTTNIFTQSTPQPAGVVSRGHTPELAQALGGAGFSDPLFVNSIVWQNRSFYFGQTGGGVVIPGDPNPTPPTYGPIANPASPYWDLAVLGGPAGATLHPASSVLTSTAGYASSNVSTPPAFVAQFFNGSRNPSIRPPETTIGIVTPAAFDEGGNFIRPIFGPLTLTDPTSATGAFFGNYHRTAGGTAGATLFSIFGLFVPGTLTSDFDRQARPTGAGSHRGADQVVTPVPVTPMPPAQ